MKNPMVYIVIVFSVFYLVGFAMFGRGIWCAWRSTQAASWPTTQGILTKAELIKDSDSDGTSYNVEVEYTYKVDGIAYSGSRLAFGYNSNIGGLDSHEKICDKLTNAKSVDVHYDPDAPGTSVLTFGIHRSIQMTFFFAVTWLFFVTGLILFLYHFANEDNNVLIRNLTVQ